MDFIILLFKEINVGFCPAKYIMSCKYTTNTLKSGRPGFHEKPNTIKILREMAYHVYPYVYPQMSTHIGKRTGHKRFMNMAH